MEHLDLIRAWAEANVETTMFYVLAIMSIPFAFGVLLDRAIIRSGFLLIGVFGTISGLFLLLEAQFLALAQVMIYAVGITLVVVIALMLTNPRLEAASTLAQPKHRLGAFMVAAMAFMTIYEACRSETFPVISQAVSPNNVQVLGKALTTTYSLPFEFASLLLLAALMGSIMLAKAEPSGSSDETDEEDITASPNPGEAKTLSGSRTV